MKTEEGAKLAEVVAKAEAQEEEDGSESEEVRDPGEEDEEGE